MPREHGNAWKAAGWLLVFGFGFALGLLAGHAGPAGEGDGEAETGWAFENPLRDARPGEWARYRVQGGQTMTIEVVAVDPRGGAVTVREEWREPRNDAILQVETRKLSPNHFLFAWEESSVIASLAPDRIRVAGRSWDCLRIETLGRATGRVRHWYSPEAPATGLLRQQREGGPGAAGPATELESWGEAE